MAVRTALVLLAFTAVANCRKHHRSSTQAEGADDQNVTPDLAGDAKARIDATGFKVYASHLVKGVAHHKKDHKDDGLPKLANVPPSLRGRVRDAEQEMQQFAASLNEPMQSADQSSGEDDSSNVEDDDAGAGDEDFSDGSLLQRQGRDIEDADEEEDEEDAGTADSADEQSEDTSSEDQTKVKEPPAEKEEKESSAGKEAKEPSALDEYLDESAQLSVSDDMDEDVKKAMGHQDEEEIVEDLQAQEDEDDA